MLISRKKMHEIVVPLGLIKSLEPHGDIGRLNIQEAQDIPLDPGALKLQDGMCQCEVGFGFGSFAHGSTLKDAVRGAKEKDMESRPVEERVAAFVKAHPDPRKKYPGKDLYEWHRVLTGSCKAGRDVWCTDHGLDPDKDKDKLTVMRFCELTINAYGGDVIKQVVAAYKEPKDGKRDNG